MPIAILFLCLAAPLSLISMDVEPAPLTDSAFLLWCGALTCKEIQREEVTNITPRGFLGIDETNISAEIFHIPHEGLFDKNKIAPGEEVEADSVTGIRDRRLGRRWRYLDDGKPEDPYRHESDEERALSLDRHGRHHLNTYFSPSGCGSEKGQAVSALPNSIWHEGGYYLYAGTCAHTDENIWITTDVFPMKRAEIRGNKDEAERFPLRIMWVEPFKKPVIMQEILLPGKTYEIVTNSVAIKFIDDQFQLFYDASAKKTEWVTTAQSTPSERSTCSITIKSPVVHRDPLSLWVYTYALDRVKKLNAKISAESLIRWYETYQHMKQGCLKEHELANTATDIRCVVDNLEKATANE